MKILYTVVIIFAAVYFWVQTGRVCEAAEVQLPHTPTEDESGHTPLPAKSYPFLREREIKKSPEAAEDDTGDIPLPEEPYIPDAEEEKEKNPLAPELIELGNFTITAYCPCEKCCGTWAIDRPGGIVYTASGAIAQEGITVAVDSSVIPIGSAIWIEGVGLRIAQDRGGAIKGDKLDLYFADHATAWAFGRQTVVVWLIGAI